MKKLKKVVSLLVVMVMALSLIPQTVLGAEYTAALESYFQGWGRWDNGVAPNGTTRYACVTDKVAHSGNNSLVIKHQQPDAGGMMVVQEGLSLTGTYTLSFWSIGLNSGKQIVVMQGQDGLWQGAALVGNATAAETDGDWTKYTLELTVPEGHTQTGMVFCSDGETEGWYIDDISIVPQGTENNVIKNGSFDFDKTAEYTTEFNAYYQNWGNWSAATLDNVNTFYCVTDEIAHSGNNSVVIKHTDPSQNWKAVMIAQDVIYGPGDYTLSFWAAGTYANNLCGMTRNGSEWDDYYITDFAVAETDGDWTKYSVDFTISGENNAITLMSNGDTQCLYVDDISLVKNGTTENLIKNSGFEEKPFEATYTTAFENYFYGWERETAIAENGSTIFTCVTDETAHSGNNSFVLKSLDTGDKDLMIKQTGLGLGEGTYTFSFWATGTVADWDNDSYRYQQIVWLEGLDPSYRYVTDMTTGETEGSWRKYTLEFTVPGGSTVNAIKLSTRGHGTEGLYVDDFSLVKNGTTNNILKNVSFEDDGIPDYTTEFEPYFIGWGNWSAATLDNVNTFYCVTDEIAHSGKNSVVIRHADSNQNWKAVTLVQEGLSYGAGTYTFSFWAAGNYANNLCGMTTNGDWWDDFYLNDFTIAETDGDWTKYTVEFTVPEGKTQNAVTLMSNGDTQCLYLDDISLVKAGTTENLIKNNGFELTEIIEEPAGPTYTDAYAEYAYGWGQWYVAEKDDNTYFSCVTNETAHSGDNSFILRHTDPDKNFKALSLVQEGLTLRGTYTLSFWAKGIRTDVDMQCVTLNGDAWAKYPLRDYAPVETDGEWSKYTFDVTVPDGKTNNTLVFCSDGQTEGWYLDEISLVAQGTTKNILKNGSFEDDGIPEYRTGLEDYFIGWSDWSAVEKDGNLVFLCVTDEMAHSGNNSFVLRHVDSSKPSNICIAQNVPSLEAGDYTISFWAVGTTNNGMQAVTLADPWVKYPVEGFQVTETDGVWSKYEKTVTATGGETAITFPTDGNTNGWFIDDISLVKVGTTENIIKNGGFEYKGLDGYYMSTPKVMKIEGESKRELTALESGTLEVSLEYTNYTMGDNFAPIMFVALYDGGNLKTVEYAEQSTSESQLEGFLEDELCIRVTVPEMTEDTDYQLKVMCWESMTGLNPLMDVLGLE